MFDVIEVLEHKPAHKMVKIITVLITMLLYLINNLQNAVLPQNQRFSFCLKKDESSIWRSKATNKIKSWVS